MRKYVAALLCMVTVVACAMGGAKKAAAPPSPAEVSSGGNPMVEPSTPKERLDELYAKVEQEREQMQLPEAQVEAGAPPTPMSTTPPLTSKTDATCKPAPSETCQTSCELSDSICINTGKICKLADELQPDDDAAAKCTKATKTCKSSHEKCCGCML